MANIAAEQEYDLSNRLRNGDSSVIKDLWSIYSRQLASICSRYVDDEALQDVLQETFIKIMLKRGQFRYQRQGSLFAWISRIAVNEALQSLRQDKRRGYVPLEGDWEDEEVNVDIGDIPPNVLIEMIRKLPPGYRTVLNLYIFEDKSHKEIAQELGIRENSSASQFHRAKAMLAKMINEYRASQK